MNGCGSDVLRLHAIQIALHCHNGYDIIMKGLFKNKPRTPAELVRHVHHLLLLLSSKSDIDQKREEKPQKLNIEISKEEDPIMQLEQPKLIGKQYLCVELKSS
ncbi:hypothetical protein HN51_012884 [Arachis hypogaea]